MACFFSPFCDRGFSLIVKVLWGVAHVSDFLTQCMTLQAGLCYFTEFLGSVMILLEKCCGSIPLPI